MASTLQWYVASSQHARIGFPNNYLQCFLSIPALVYQVVVPMWTRAWRFANVYAYLAIDLLLTLLWFAAFIAVAVWQSRGVTQGVKDGKNKDSHDSCAHFAYGSATKCTVTKASAGMGAFVFLLWAATSGISITMAMKYRRTGVVDKSLW